MPPGECVFHTLMDVCMHRSQAAVVCRQCSSQAICMQRELRAPGGWGASAVWLLVMCYGGGGEQITWLPSDQDQIPRNLRGKVSYTSTERAMRETARNEWTGNASRRSCALTLAHSIQSVARQLNLAGKERLSLMLTSRFT